MNILGHPLPAYFLSHKLVKATKLNNCIIQFSIQMQKIMVVSNFGAVAIWTEKRGADKVQF